MVYAGARCCSCTWLPAAAKPRHTIYIPSTGLQARPNSDLQRAGQRHAVEAGASGGLGVGVTRQIRMVSVWVNCWVGVGLTLVMASGLAASKAGRPRWRHHRAVTSGEVKLLSLP